RSAQECDLVWLVRPLLRTRRVDLRSDECESLCLCRQGRGLMKTETTDMNRRESLSTTAAVGGAMVLGFWLPPEAAPAQAAVAEMQGLTGKDLLLGIVVGYEIQLRLRDATEGGGIRGWDAGTVATSYASAAVAAKLLGLDASKIAYAIAIAGAHGNTLAEVR